LSSTHNSHSLQALEYLTLTNFDLASAVSEYYTSQEEEDMAGSGSGSGAEPENQVPEGYNGPRTLDGRPAPQSTSAIPTVGSSSSSARQPPRRGIATLGSLGQSSSGHGHDHDDDDDTDDEDYTPDENPRDLFAGGEKSGLAVQDPARRDPRSLVNDIIKKAQA
jgi:UBX domain-containing protein 1